MTTETRLGRALRLRDLALAIVRRQGTWKGAGKVNLLMVSHGTISIGYRSPFQRLPDASDQLKCRAAQLGRRALQNLPHGPGISTWRGSLACLATALAVIASEAAFWYSDETSANGFAGRRSGRSFGGRFPTPRPCERTGC